MKNLSNINI
jgi:hypothetical protein